VTVTVDLASVDTGDQQRDAVLPSADWFDVAGHPKATFRSTRIRILGKDRFVADGALEMKGVSRPLSLPFRLRTVGQGVEAVGDLALDRTAFGVGQGEFASTEQIPAGVKVRVRVRAKAQQPRRPSA
jgi:polyisoprenoid-binding protein YceI